MRLNASWCMVLTLLPASAAYRCSNATDCELLGECVAGQCRCFSGFTGPSCAQLDLLPAPAPLRPAWPPAGGFGSHNRSRQAYGWGFSVAPDADNASLLHAVANVGCYDPFAGMVSGTFLLHVQSTTGASGPWKPVGIVAPPTTFNAHLRLAPSGQYVLFLRGTHPMPSPANWSQLACAGVSQDEWQSLVSKGPYISAEQLQDPIGNFVATTKTMGPGQWHATAFTIVGQDATCGNKSVIDHNSNPSAVILPNGVVVLAYRYTFRSGSESVNIAVSQNITGPYEAVFPCDYTMTSNTWGE